MRRGGGVYVAYITSRSGLDATFIQLMKKEECVLSASVFGVKQHQYVGGWVRTSEFL